MLSQIALLGLLATSCARDLKNQKKARENAKAAATANAKLAVQNLYLIHMLEQHGVVADEFDLIALSNIVNA